MADNDAWLLDTMTKKTPTRTVIVTVSLGAVVALGLWLLHGFSQEAAGMACQMSVVPVNGSGGYHIEWSVLPLPHWDCIIDYRDGNTPERFNLGWWWPSPR